MGKSGFFSVCQSLLQSTCDNEGEKSNGLCLAERFFTLSGEVCQNNTFAPDHIRPPTLVPQDH